MASGQKITDRLTRLELLLEEFQTIKQKIDSLVFPSSLPPVSVEAVPEIIPSIIASIPEPPQGVGPAVIPAVIEEPPQGVGPAVIPAVIEEPPQGVGPAVIPAVIPTVIPTVIPAVIEEPPQSVGPAVIDECIHESHQDKVSMNESNTLSEPALMGTLINLGHSSYIGLQEKLCSAYKAYVDNFLDTHLLETDQTILMDYRLILLTLEFISTASDDICKLGGLTELDIDIATNCTLWFLTYYKKMTATARLNFPDNIELLIKSYYDIKAHKYTFSAVKYLAVEEKKKRKSLLSKSKIRWATLKRRFNRQNV